MKVIKRNLSQYLNRLSIVSLLIITPFLSALGQKDSTGAPMFLNVNEINLELKKLNGEGQFTNQYSWMLTGSNASQTETWYFPQDEWHSQMLFQIYNPLCPDDDGIIDEDSVKYIIPPEDGSAFRSVGVNVYSWERRRYRPPEVVVDDVPLFRAYRGTVDPDLPANMVASWEDILRNHGMRVRVNVYAYTNPNHNNYIIWQTTYKFTGETRPPIQNPGPEHFFPDQTVNMWFPIAWSFGPTKAGEREVQGSFSFESTDDLDSWFERPTELTDMTRDNLKIAYYWDTKTSAISNYPNGSNDDSGDPDRGTGHLLSPQIPGYALLHASTSGFDPANDDLSQPFSMPHATIMGDFWGRRDVGRRDTYIGTDNRGKFPKDAITEGFNSSPEYGNMRFLTVGPYEFTLNKAAAQYDSISVVYAIGVGSISWEKADSVGKAWFEGEITDQEKNEYILTGKDSLFQTMDRAMWAWSRDFDIPDPPPSPDLTVTSDADQVLLEWSYPSEDHFKDPDTQVDDWYAWRVYRKKGAAFVNSPADDYSGETWEMIYETTDKSETEYTDTDITRGVSYYYAVTAVDDGSQNTTGLNPGEKLESSRHANRTIEPAIPFKAGLASTDKVRIVPNPATVAAGALAFPGAPENILFANLPYKCQLHVFTETGDKIMQITHRGTDQEIWNQRTDANQYVTSGLYILAVTNAKTETGKSLPDQFVKFTLTR